MSITIEDLDKRLDELNIELAKFDALKEEQSELIAARKVMLRLGSFAHSSNEEPKINHDPSLDGTGAINLDELELPVKMVKNNNSLLSTVQSLVERFGDQEFTISHVEAALRKMGKATNAKHFKSRVSVTIKKLADRGVVERTFKGSGNIPHKYRNKGQSSVVSFMDSGNNEG